MNQSEKRNISKKDTQQLTTEWYNQNEELYRSYLQNLSLRLRDQPNYKSQVNSLIRNYLKAEEQLLQVAKTDKYAITPPKEVFKQEINASEKEIDANQKQIYELQKDISTKTQQKQLLIKLLEINLQNYKKSLETFSNTISQPDNSDDRASQKHITFEVPNLQANLNQATISKIIDEAKNAYNQAESHKLGGGLLTLQLQKENLVGDICEVIEKEALPQEMHPLYDQKEQTLKSIKAIQSQISKYLYQVENKQRLYDQTSLKNKNLNEEINRLRLRTVQEQLNFEVEQQETSIQPPFEGELPQNLGQKIDKNSNKMITFQHQTPYKTRLMLLFWAVAILLFWLIAV